MFRQPHGRARRPRMFGAGAGGWVLLVSVAALAGMGCGAGDSVNHERDDEVPAPVSTANLCPQFSWWLLLPRSLRLGETSEILVNVFDPDTPRSKLKLDWAAANGVFSELHEADTSYTCQRRGRQLLTLDARDDLDCISVLELNVDCLAP
jgi:hypothetical protein